MNPFDVAKRAAFKTTTRLMGYDAQWSSFQARVHFEYPSGKDELMGIEYTPEEPIMEYMENQFPGLKALADTNAVTTVTIDGKGTFFVRAVHRKVDGDICIAILQPST